MSSEYVRLVLVLIMSQETTVRGHDDIDITIGTATKRIIAIIRQYYTCQCIGTYNFHDIMVTFHWRPDT